MPTTNFQRGQRGPLSADAQPVVEVTVAIDPGHIRSDIDVCCVGLDAQRRMADDRYFIFYNQPRSPEGAITVSTERSRSRFTVDTARLPATIEYLVFTASIDGAERMPMLGASSIRAAVAGASADVVHEFSGRDFQNEQALLVGELYRKNGQWRFWAVSQGFAGGLPRLLEHFGADVAGDTVSTSVAAPPAAPAPAPARPTVVAQHGDTALQRLIDGAPAGGVLVLPRNEYQGPGTIDKPLRVEGNGSTLWSRAGPVLRVTHPGVELHQLGVEATVQTGGGDTDVALDIAPGCAPRLDGIQVRGRVRGLEEEAGEWALPGAISLGRVAPRHRNEFRLALRVPVACRLTSAVAGVRLQPEALSAGDNEVRVVVEGVGAETLIAGEILLHSPHLQRTIALTGSTVGGEGSAPVEGALLWGPAS